MKLNGDVMNASASPRRYVVPTIGDLTELAPSELKIFRNPTSKADNAVTKDQIFSAVMEHCRFSMEQAQPLLAAQD